MAKELPSQGAQRVISDCPARLRRSDFEKPKRARVRASCIELLPASFPPSMTVRCGLNSKTPLSRRKPRTSRRSSHIDNISATIESPEPSDQGLFQSSKLRFLGYRGELLSKLADEVTTRRRLPCQGIKLISRVGLVDDD